MFACYGTLTNASICSDMRLYVRNSLADSRGNAWSSLLEHDCEFLLPAIGIETRAKDNRAQPGAQNTGDSTVLCRLRMNCCIHNNCLLQNAMLGLRKSGGDEKAEISDSVGFDRSGPPCQIQIRINFPWTTKTHGIKGQLTTSCYSAT